jgi:hypothetical protein
MTTTTTATTGRKNNLATDQQFRFTNQGVYFYIPSTVGTRVRHGQSDVDLYTVIGKLLDSVFSILRYTDACGKYKHTYTGLFYRKVAYTRYDVPSFVEWMCYRTFHTELVCINLNEY